MTSCPAQSLRIAFYNVENAFDTLRSPGKDDAEFTPQGEKRWDTRRYRTKIDHLAQVAADLSADLLALAEVENTEVLADIAQRVREMTGEGYLGICLESGDRRGIHPALLYRREVFSPTAPAKILPVPHNERGILYVKGAVLVSGDTLHLFINHWTSRYMGQKATEGARDRRRPAAGPGGRFDLRVLGIPADRPARRSERHTGRKIHRPPDGLASGAADAPSSRIRYVLLSGGMAVV